MLRVGTLYEDDDLVLVNASVDGLIARDKRAGRTVAATRAQLGQLEDVLAWLDRMGITADQSPPPDAVSLTYGLFAAAISRPGHERSREIFGSRPQVIAAKLVASMDAAEKHRRGVPMPDPQRSFAPHPLLPAFGHPYERAAYLVFLASAVMFCGGLALLFIAAVGSGSYAPVETISSLIFKDYRPSSIRALAWLRMPVIASPFIAAAAWVAAFQNSGIRRIWQWVKSGN